MDRIISPPMLDVVQFHQDKREAQDKIEDVLKALRDKYPGVSIKFIVRSIPVTDSKPYFDVIELIGQI